MRYWMSRTSEERFAETVRLSIEMYAELGIHPSATPGRMIRKVQLSQISRDDY